MLLKIKSIGQKYYQNYRIKENPHKIIASFMSTKVYRKTKILYSFKTHLQEEDMRMKKLIMRFLVHSLALIPILKM